ncbi:MAG: CHAT domain-containing protein, partial [Acidobacteria bacterium]|nr:CHAT domain-containing protein [Acidobacteriota bacterium]
MVPALWLELSCTGWSSKKAGPTPEVAERLLRTSHASQALRAAEEGLNGTYRDPETPEHWRLRTVQVEALTELEEFQKREKILALPVPEKARGTADGVRFLLARRDPKELPALRATIQKLGLQDLLRREQATAALAKLPSPAAEAELRRLRTEALQAGDQKTYAFATGNLGFYYEGHFRLDEAAALFEELLQSATKTSDLLTVASTEANLGWVRQLMGQEERAEEYFTRAGKTFERLGSTAEQRLALRNLGAIAYFRGDYAAARRWAEQAQRLLKPESPGTEVVGVLSDLAASDIELNRTAEAEASLKRAEAVPGYEATFEYPWILLTRGRLAEKRGENPLEQYHAAAKLESGRDQAAIVEARLRIANWLGTHGPAKPAISAYEDAVATVAKLRRALRRDESKMAFLSTVTRVYQDYVDFLVAAKQPMDALRVADSSRLQVFSEAAPQPFGVKFDLARLSAKLAKAKAAVYYYWLGPKRSFVWIIDGKGARLGSEIAASKTFVDLVDAYQDFIERGGAVGPFSYQPAYELREQLIDRVKTPLPKRLIVVPDGALHWINFETLAAPAGDQLILQTEVAVAPSLSVLTAGQPSTAKPATATTALLIGDPITGEASYPRLANAHAELESIAALYPKNNTRFEERAATPQAYFDAKPATFDVIHFAAHAEANSRSPLDSAVVLTPEGGKGNRLTARQVLSEPLKGALVTLSACQSAGSK